MKKYIGSVCVFLIRGIRPLLGEAHCPYPLSCSNYAIKQFQDHNLFQAFYKSASRLLSCHPFTLHAKKEDFL